MGSSGVSGGGATVLSSKVGSYSTGTQSGTNAALITDGTTSLSVTVPAAAHARTAVLSGTLIFMGSNNHSEFMYGLDLGSSPLVNAVSVGDRNSSANSDGNKVLHISGVPIAIPGDGATHQIACYTTAQGTTNASTITAGGMSVVVSS